MKPSTENLSNKIQSHLLNRILFKRLKFLKVKYYRFLLNSKYNSYQRTPSYSV